MRCERLGWGIGIKIVHLSDLHLKCATRASWLEERLNEIDPDLVAMTGDYADTPAGMTAFSGLLERTAGRWPTAWIAGNHDRWYGRAFLHRLQSVSAAHCIDERPAELRKERQIIRVLSPREAADAGPRAAEEKRIVLVHNPRHIRTEWLANCDLVLAGHLHGGQFILWTSRSGMHYPGTFALKWCCDRKEVRGTTVIVSRGYGDFIPIRFRCPREIILIEG